MEMTKLRISKDRYNALDNLYTNIKEERLRREADPEWQKDNLEYDLRTSDKLCEKAQDGTYAQNLYAALCNTEWQHRDMFTILKGDTWSCSWRYAAGVVADMREKGDYIDFYINHEHVANSKSDLVEIGTVTDEVRADLYELGWVQVD